MQCNRCGAALTEEESISFRGKTLCEDCYMYESNPPKACDPMAVASALSVRKQMGQSGAEGLTDLQKKIYTIIKEKGQIARPELVAAVGIKPDELEAQFAILRHCELIRAHKEGSTVYITLW
jgi:late competence protein required for DNA uptake (superfamily II DNA/RNA helicase)